MALLSYGNVREEYRKPIKNFYENFMLYYDEINNSVEKNLRILLDDIGELDNNFLDKDKARDLLATSQEYFEETVKKHVYPLALKKQSSRIVMVGGCALNVTMNSKIVSDLGIEVFVPPCPNDCGISLGAAKIFNPNLSILKRPFTDVEPSYREFLLEFERNYFSKYISIKELAHILEKGNIVATMLGSLEIGPRALGQRSYLANPLIPGMKNKLNSPSIKDREYWRPIAPVVSLDCLSEYFMTTNSSPYMSFAPKINIKYQTLLKEIAHKDGTARVQTVSQEMEWMYALLEEVKKINGISMLMNTSFNKKGKPLINNYKEAYDVFRKSDLDAIVISESVSTKGQNMRLFSKKEI